MRSRDPVYAPCLFCGEPRAPGHPCDGRQGHVEQGVILGPDFDGETYEPDRDHARLTGQLQRVADVMRDGRWRTYAEIEAVTGDPPQSISARLRDLRKEKFGGFTVERRIRDEARSAGLWEYRVVPPTATEGESYERADLRHAV